MVYPDLLLEDAYFLRTFFLCIAQHLLPPVRIFTFWQGPVYSLFQRILVNVVKVEFGRFGSNNPMKLWALFELLGLSLPAKLLHNNVISMHVGVGNFRNKLKILFYQSIDLLVHIRKIFEIKSLTVTIFSWGCSILIIYM